MRDKPRGEDSQEGNEISWKTNEPPPVPKGVDDDHRNEKQLEQPLKVTQQDAGALRTNGHSTEYKKARCRIHQNAQCQYNGCVVSPSNPGTGLKKGEHQTENASHRNSEDDCEPCPLERRIYIHIPKRAEPAVHQKKVLTTITQIAAAGTGKEGRHQPIGQFAIGRDAPIPGGYVQPTDGQSDHDQRDRAEIQKDALIALGR